VDGVKQIVIVVINMPKAFAVDLTFHGPITIKPPLLSTASTTYVVPPPSTLFGALYYAYASYFGNYQEVVESNGRKCSPVVNWIVKKRAGGTSGGNGANGDYGGVVNRVATEEPILIDATMIINEPLYQQPPVTHTIERAFNWIRSSKEKQVFTVGYIGLSFIKSATIIYVVRDDYLEDLKRVAWGIVRIGRKEGLVSVDRVYDVEPLNSPIGVQFINVVGYFPYNAAEGYNVNLYQNFPDPYDEHTYCGGDVKLITYAVAASPTRINIKGIKADFKPVKIKDESYVIVRWQ
jgi:CRISPR-associated protein Cas5 subtype I-A